MVVIPPNSGNLATDDAHWLLVAMLRGYNDRHLGRFLANVEGILCCSTKRSEQ